MNLSNKVVAITGSTGGLGQALAHSMSAKGAHLVLIGRQADRLTALADTLDAATRCITVEDLSDSAGIAALAQQLRDMEVDVLVNNAGINEFACFRNLSETDLDSIIGVNLLSPMKLTLALLDHLTERRGMVVNVGSAYGFIGYPGNAVYCASKFGLRGFSEALYREMSGLGLKVVFAAPRAIDTPMNDARVIGLNTELGNHADSPSVVAEAIIRQIETERHRTVMGAPEAFFAKLNGFFPRLVDRALMKKAETVRAWAILPNKG